MTTQAPERLQVRLPGLYRKQREAIFNPARYVVIEASTKSGKTHGALLWLLWIGLELGREGRAFWWIAPTTAQAKIAYGRLKRALPQGFWRSNDSDHTLIAPNGAVFSFLTGEKPDYLYGEDVWAAVIDEATRVRREAWIAVRSTLTATEGPIRLIGNVKGRMNWVYDLARKAEAGRPNWHYARLTAYDAVQAGVLSAEEVEDAKATLPPDVFAELYLAVPRDNVALIYAPFSQENIDERADFKPGGGPIYISYDWGFTDPTHICLLQYRDGVFYQFDELTGSGRSEREWVREVVRRVCDLPSYDGPSYAEWVTIWDKTHDFPRPWPNCWPDYAAGDPSAVQLRAELKEHGISAYKPATVQHNVETGQDILRAAILSGEGLRRLLVHPRCTETIECLRNYRARELENGTFDPRPDPSPENHRWSHGTDSLRYFVFTRRFDLGLGALEAA